MTSTLIDSVIDEEIQNGDENVEHLFVYHSRCRPSIVGKIVSAICGQKVYFKGACSSHKSCKSCDEIYSLIGNTGQGFYNCIGCGKNA